MEHDNSYKLLFSHPQMVEDLLTGFVPEAWVRELDFNTLEKVSNGFVSDDLRDREDDVIWRVRWGNGWLYVYLLLEFQSTVDAYMAVRIHTYIGLLYQDLIKQKQLTPEGLLPPIFPLVLYNGERRWGAATNIAELIQPVPGGLEHYKPSLRYLLLDEGALDSDIDRTTRNLASALFSLENAQNPDQLKNMVERLSDWLQASEQSSLRRSFTVWIKRVLLPGRMPGIELPEINDLQEVKSMLAERVQDWTRDWKQQGIEEGRAIGIEEGREEGRKEGREEGREEGRKEGQEAGRLEGERLLIIKQLTRRFGPLNPDTIECLETANADQLERWAENLLEANSLEEVFQ